MAALHCTVCGVELTGGLDTFGPPGAEMCQEHWIAVGETDTDDDLLIDEWDEGDENDFFDDDEEEFVERHNMLFCSACGLLAQAGDEEFDWCDHITGRGCTYFAEQWGESEGGW